MPQPIHIPKLGKKDSWLRVVVVLVLLGIGLYSAWQKEAGQKEKEQRPAEQPPPATDVEQPRLKLPPIASNERESAPQAKSPRSAEAPATASRIITGQSIRDQNGRLVFRGDVDVGPTLDRIDRNQRLEFSNDGTVFQNRERRLPRKPANYYREFVHPTPGLGGPGPQRIVTGREGETYYTPDHYRSFRRLD